LFKSILETVRREFSGQAAKGQVAIISQYHRIQASPGYRAAAQYCKDYLSAQGIPAEVLSYPATDGVSYWGMDSFREWDASDGQLYLLQEDGSEEKLADYREIKISLIQRSTSFDGEAEVVVLEDGEEEADYDGLEVSGKVVMTRGDLRRVYELAVAARGAAGILFDGMRTVPPIREPMDLPDARQYTSFWWSKGDRPCFGFVLSPRQGARLRRLAARKDHPALRVRAHVEGRLYDGALEVVSAFIEGQRDEEVILTAHLCHPQPSCNDNASGSAVALEAARALNALIQRGELPRPRRGIRFLWVPEMTGTYAYLASHEESIPGIIAGVNLDMVGENQDLCRSSFLIERPPMSTPSFAPVLMERIREDLTAGTRSHSGMGGYALFRHATTPFSGGSDHYILSDPSVGIPTPMLIQWPDKFYHTSEDTLDKVDPSMLSVVGQLAATYLYFLAQAGDDEAAWLGHEMVAGYKAELTRAIQAIVSDAFAAGTEQELSKVAQSADVRASFMLRHAREALGSLARLSPEAGKVVARLQDEAERFTGGELRLAREAIARRRPAPGVTPHGRSIVEEEDEWEAHARHLVPRRLLRGPISARTAASRLSRPDREALYRLRKEHKEAPRAMPVVALYWADGERTLAQIADLVELEIGHRDTEFLVRYFELLDLAELIELKAEA